MALARGSARLGAAGAAGHRRRRGGRVRPGNGRRQRRVVLRRGGPQHVGKPARLLYGAFDPAGTVTVDKLPGALWVQALSLRIFGFHIWALVLPQVAEGVLTVLVLYRAVRGLAGPQAGLTAAAVLAVTPVTVLLSRGNVSTRC